MAIAMMFVVTSCTEDEGFEGKASINGKVTYTNGTAAGAIVTVAFGATEVTNSVDYSTAAGADGSFSFNSLQKGNYYVDAVYTDANGHVFNTGGTVVEIGGAKNEVEVNLALK